MYVHIILKLNVNNIFYILFKTFVTQDVYNEYWFNYEN